MRDALFRTIRWNCLAGGRMMTTHRNERELRTNILILIGQVLALRRRFWLPVPIERNWPDDGWRAESGRPTKIATDSEADRIIPLTDRLRRRQSDAVGACQGLGKGNNQ